MMRKRYFRASKKPRQLGIIVTVLVLVLGCSGAFAVYHWLHPFHSFNPLHHEITVGEKVIDDWKYDGKNQAGYLVFVNNDFVQHMLPPNAQELALDGKYVVIEEATPNSLTYAEPVESYSFTWIVIGLLLFALIAFLLFKSSTRNMKMKFPTRRHLSFNTHKPNHHTQLLRMKSRLWFRRRLSRWRR